MAKRGVTRKISDETILEMNWCRGQGFTYKQIAERFDICLSSAYLWTDDLNERKITTNSIKEIKKLRLEGVRVVDIAKKFNVDRSTIYNYTREVNNATTI